MDTESDSFAQEIKDQGFAVDVFRVAYGTGVLGVDMSVGDEAYLRTITVRVEIARSYSKLEHIYGFATDTDIRIGDHWRYRDRNDWEKWYTVTLVTPYPYGVIVMVKNGK